MNLNTPAPIALFPSFAAVILPSIPATPVAPAVPIVGIIVGPRAAPAAATGAPAII